MLAALVVCTPALAKKAKPAPKPAGPKYTYAVFLPLMGNPNKAMLAAVRAQLVPRPAALPAARIITGKLLQKALKTNPEAAIGKCGSKLDCMAALGKKAGADKVLYARISTSGKGVGVQCLVVNVATQDVAQKAAFTINDAKEVKSTVSTQLAALFPEAATVEVASAAGDDEPALVFDAGGSPGATDSTPALASVPGSTDNTPATASSSPASTPSQSGDVSTIVAAPAGSSPLADAASQMPAASDTGPSPTGRSHVLGYTGGGVAGAGIVALAVGAVFGMQSQSTFNSIHPLGSSSPTPQKEAMQKLQDSNSAASRANLFMAAGGGVAAVGAALLVTDMFFLHRNVTPAVVVTNQGAGASLTWRF